MFPNQSEATVKVHPVKLRPHHDDIEERGEVPLIRESAEDKHAERRAKKMANKLHFALMNGS